MKFKLILHQGKIAFFFNLFPNKFLEDIFSLVLKCIIFMTCRTFRWKFNNSGETLDVGSERFSVNGSRSILKYTPITDQVSKKSNMKITTLTQSPGSKVDLKMQKPLSFYCSGLWNVIVLGLQ